ncbi:MAG: HpnA: hopanoid-associated sugar epimerase [Firmicutes bacterium]|nr:HpnA: hopanoid-associated sugar epimerase [Bacillota bacterium]
MNILLAGGAGDVGTHLNDFFCRSGHQVVIVDKQQYVSAGLLADNVTFYEKDLTDAYALKRIVTDHAIDVIVDLAWSFADNPRVLFEQDIVGQINLMEAAVEGGVKRFIYTSTAGVYGTPMLQPIVEEQTCRPELARKPLYSVAKLAAEQLGLAWGVQYKLLATVIRFWWAFGDTIGGKHLRALVEAALKDEPIRLVAGAGGAFTSMDDLAVSVELAAGKEAAIGQTYNIASLFLTWQEISAMLIELTGSKSQVVMVDSSIWSGPAFLAERWQLSWEKVARELGYKPLIKPDQAKVSFQRALAHCVDQVREHM